MLTLAKSWTNMHAYEFVNQIETWELYDAHGILKRPLLDRMGLAMSRTHRYSIAHTQKM
jgi:hypothetical protein